MSDSEEATVRNIWRQHILVCLEQLSVLVKSETLTGEDELNLSAELQEMIEELGVDPKQKIWKLEDK